MAFDFSLILVVATAVAGVIWLLDVAALRARRRAHDGIPVVVEYARSFLPILLVVLVVRSFLFEPFRIPSSSMLPTLLVGDFIFVNKYVYGLRLPVVNTKVWEIDDPMRGDVVVFRLPADPGTNYIKRLVGLPGDTVRYVNKRLYLNDEAVSYEELGRYTGSEQPGSVLLAETLDEVTHNVLLLPGQQSLEGVYVIPKGHYFMMGDNRDNSRDSRYRGVGLIPEANVVGKAVRIWMNWDFPAMPRWSRIGNAIN